MKLINGLKATNEEYITYEFFKSLQNKKIVKSIIFQPESFILNKKVKFKNKILTREHKYTTDFKIIWNKINEINIINEKYNKKNFFYAQKINNQIISYVEVKPTFDRYNMTRAFTTYIQPIMLLQNNIYVQLFKPKSDIIKIKNFK